MDCAAVFSEEEEKRLDVCHSHHYRALLALNGSETRPYTVSSVVMSR